MSPRSIRLAIVLLALAALRPSAGVAGAEFRFIAPQQRTLANGLRVAVFPRPNTGVVQVQLRIAAGVSVEREDESGAATLTAQMLDQGTTSRPAAAFSRDLDRVGGSLAASAQREAASVAAAFLPEDLEGGLELLSDAVINPVFDEARFASVRNQSGRALLQLHSDPAATADEEIWLAALPNVAAARPVVGSLGGLLTSTRETARSFYRDHYRPNRAVLTIAGDVSADRAFALAEQWFTRWSGTAAAPVAESAPKPPAETRIRLVDRPAQTAAVVRLGWRTPGGAAEDDLDRVAGARLLQASLTRALKGRSPGQVEVGLNEVSSAGFLEVGFVAPADSVPAALSRVRRVMRDALASVPDTALAALVRQIRATYALRFETLGGLLSQWLSADLVSSDASRALAEYPDHAAALTPASVSKALARDLDLEDPAIAVVGPAARLRAPLAKLGSVELVPLDQPPAAVVQAERDTLKTPTKDDERIGREWGAKAIAAHGGLEKLRAIRTATVESDVSLQLEGRTLRGTMRQLRKEPYRMVFATSFESFETRQVLSGTRAWSLAPDGQLQDADSVGVKALRTGFTSDVPHLLVSLADPSAKVVSRGTARLGDREVRVLEVTLGGDRRRLYLNPDNAQLLGMDQNEESSGSSRLMARRLYGDLRTVNGVLIPYEEERQLEGRTVMKLTVTKAELNGEIADTEFQRPTGAPAAPGTPKN
jgi:predicted Zn-dependent peptidase